MGDGCGPCLRVIAQVLDSDGHGAGLGSRGMSVAPAAAVPYRSAFVRLPTLGPAAGPVKLACLVPPGLPAAPWRTSASWRRPAGPVERAVQRSVQALVSRQYQRTSSQALPPSATMWSADSRMPHIQQDVTRGGPSRSGVKRC